MLQSRDALERSHSILGGTKFVTQPGKIVNSVSREKTRFTFQECEEMRAGLPRRCDSCANCIRRSGRAQELTRREQKELGLIETNMKVDPEAGNIHRSTHARGAWPVDLLAVAMMDSPAEARRVRLGTIETTWSQDGLLGPVEVPLVPRETWPASRTFCRTLPTEELRAKVFSANSNAGGSCKAEATFQLSAPGVVKEILDRYTNYQKVKRIIARWLQAQICSDREAILEPATVQTLRLAELLIFQVGAEETDQLMRTNKEKLAGLAPCWSKGVFGSPGGWVTRGRLRKGIFSILGVHELPILLPESRLAYLLMIQAHEQDHK